MTLPPENLETLLNEYLDDALRGERLTELEAALARDSATSLRLEQLRSERAERLSAMRDDPRFRDVRLDSGFSQRVLAAVAETPGTSPAHRLAPVSATPATASHRRWVRLVAAVAALAATLLLAINLFPKDDGKVEIANSGLPRIGSLDPAATAGGILNIGPQPATETPGVNLPLQPEPAVVSNDAASVKHSPALAADHGSVGESAMSPEAVADPEAMAAATVPDSAAPHTIPDRDPAPAIAPDNLAPFSMVLVYEVTRTVQGKSNDSVLTALRDAGIDLHAHRAVGEDVVGYLREAHLIGDKNADDERASILYIEASGKALDRFMVSMFSDTENIDQLRWTVATDPPLVAAVKQLQKLPVTEVRHAADTSSAWRLVSGEDDQLDFAASATSRPLMPLRRDDRNAMGSSDQGPDIQSRLILLVR